MQTYKHDIEWATQREADGYMTPEEAAQYMQEAEENLRIDLGVPIEVDREFLRLLGDPRRSVPASKGRRPGPHGVRKLRRHPAARGNGGVTP